MVTVFESVFSRSKCLTFVQLPLSTLQRSFSGESNAEEVIDVLNKKIAEYKKFLSSHSRSSYLAKKTDNSLQNLSSQLANIRQKMSSGSNSMIPNSITLEVVSNGTTHLKPCVVLHTNFKDYLFNCPEGTSRFLAANRLKVVNLSDIFFTRDTWDNFAGVSGILKTAAATPGSVDLISTIRLHGSFNKSTYFEHQNEHADTDFASTMIAKIEERAPSRGVYSDDAVIINYIPVTSFASPQRTEPNRLDIAFLVELKRPPRSLDARKIRELRIPGGPHMKQLKDGFDVTLADGRLIKSEEVLQAEQYKVEPSCLVVECSDFDKVPSLQSNTMLREYMSGIKVMKYVVHFTEEKIMSSIEYQSWMDSFGIECQHLIVNGTGPCLPHIEAAYKINVFLNYISPRQFPLLHPSNFNGILRQDDECETFKNRLYVRPFQRFFMRKPRVFEPSEPSVHLVRTELLLQLKEDEYIVDAVATYKQILQSNTSRCRFPKVAFLGTSSAIPTNYRNVSCYLVQLSETSNVLVDCGEGSYGQMRVLFGSECCDDILFNLNTVFITHGHQDHYQGLFTIIKQRKNVYERRGFPYKPLTVLSGHHIMRTFRDVDRSFDNHSQYVRIIDLSRMMWNPQTRVMTDALSLAEALKSNDDFLTNNLKDVLAVKVRHSRNAVGYVFTDLNDKKIVFSGDTMPCELLVKYGMDATLLVHEATFADDEDAHALFKKHSTMKQAFDIATKMRAKNLILTHFSAKYPKVPNLPDYIEKVGNVTIAMDNMIVDMDDLRVTGKLIPVLRNVFANEINELKQRSLKRQRLDEEIASISDETIELTPKRKEMLEKAINYNLSSRSLQ